MNPDNDTPTAPAPQSAVLGSTYQSLLQAAFKSESLAGKCFLDIACGSGEFSLAAYQLGAEKIVSLAQNKISLDTCMAHWTQAGKPAHWEILSASLQNTGLYDLIGSFDAVFSWGGIQHSPSFWKDLERAAEGVAPKGRLFMALENKTSGLLGTRMRRALKGFSASAPRAAREAMEILGLAGFNTAKLLQCRNPFPAIDALPSGNGQTIKQSLAIWHQTGTYVAAAPEKITAYIASHCTHLKPSESPEAPAGLAFFTYDGAKSAPAVKKAKPAKAASKKAVKKKTARKKAVKKTTTKKASSSTRKSKKQPPKAPEEPAPENTTD